jgi:hypothetical protein
MSNITSNPQETAQRLFAYELKQHSKIFDQVVEDLKNDPRMLFAAAFTMGVVAALSAVGEGSIAIVNKGRSNN